MSYLDLLEDDKKLSKMESLERYTYLRKTLLAIYAISNLDPQNDRNIVLTRKLISPYYIFIEIYGTEKNEKIKKILKSYKFPTDDILEDNKILREIVDIMLYNKEINK